MRDEEVKISLAVGISLIAMMVICSIIGTFGAKIIFSLFAGCIGALGLNKRNWFSDECRNVVIICCVVFVACAFCLLGVATLQEICDTLKMNV